MKKIAGSGSGSISQRHGSADPDPHQNTGNYARLYLDHKTSAWEITIAGPPRCLEDGIAGHDPGSLAQLCSAGRKGNVNGAGVAAGDAHLDGAAPGVDLLVNAHLEPGLAIENPPKKPTPKTPQNPPKKPLKMFFWGF